MNEPDRNEEQELRDLLQRAGARPEVPATDLAALRAAAHAAWRGHLEEKSAARRRRDWRPFALAAAGLLVAVGAAWWWSALRLPSRAEPMARVAQLQGTAWKQLPGARDPVALAAGETLTVATELSLPAGSLLALDLSAAQGTGPAVRVAGGSRLRLAAPSAVELTAGAVYVDTQASEGGAAAGGRPLAVTTPLGLVRHVGTQFEVRLEEPAPREAALRVRVREGAVLVVGEGLDEIAEAGQEVRLRQDGSVERAAVLPYGPAWQWVLAAAPSFDIEGRSLPDFLAWIRRETGWQVEFADPGLEAEAREIVLHGSIEGLRPDQAPAVVLPGCGLEHELAEGRLVVRRPGPSAS